MKTESKISVIIPTYNRIETLKRAIESVLAQEHKNVEIIVVDDNDNADTKKKVKEICSSLNSNGNILLYETAGKIGGGMSRNIGCKKATGDYLAFLDDDDIYLPGKLSEQLRFTCENHLDMSFQDVIWANENEKIIEYRKFDYITDWSNDNLLKQHLMHNIAPTSIYFIKRDKFLKTNGFGDLPVGQDIYLMFDCINKGFSIGYMKGAYVKQYLHSGDRLSKGQKKIDGENWWYKEKKKYMSVLSLSERRFFSFRHYMILLFACIRSGYYVKASVYAFMGFLISPKNAIVEGMKYLSQKRKIYG